MKPQKWMVLAIVIVALVAAVILVPAALAQRPGNSYGFGYNNGPAFNDTAGFGPGMMGRGRAMGPGSRMMGPGYAAGPMAGRGGQWGGPNNSLVAVVANVLEIDRTDLIAQLQNDKTLADVIADHDVALDTVIDTFLAPRVEQLAEQVANEQLTQDQADAMLATMRANVGQQLNQEWSPRGPGQGNGPGFVDADGDGVCDHAGLGRGGGQGYGPGFVDADGDGVCDHAGAMGRGRFN